MTKNEIIKKNRLIAEYLKYTNNYWYQNNVLRYNFGWNSLMEAVEKIMAEKFDYGEFVFLRTFGMVDSDGKYMVRFNRHQINYGNTLIEATYNAVIDFINLKKQTT